ANLSSGRRAPKGLGVLRADDGGAAVLAAPPWVQEEGPGLEGDVVVARRPAARRCGRRGLHVAGIDGDVAAGGEAAAVSAARVVAAAQELDGVGDDLDRLALLALVGLPLAPLQAAVDRHRPALGEELGAVLALGAPDGD